MKLPSYILVLSLSLTMAPLGATACNKESADKDKVSQASEYKDSNTNRQPNMVYAKRDNSKFERQLERLDQRMTRLSNRAE